MAWLTDDEREANARRDRDAQRRGFKSDHDEGEALSRRKRDDLVKSARRKLTPEEFRAVQLEALGRTW